jgi:hypothetical protein
MPIAFRVSSLNLSPMEDRAYRIDGQMPFAQQDFQHDYVGQKSGSGKLLN